MTAGIRGVAVCPCSCLRSLEVYCWAAAPNAHAPRLVSAATVAAADRAFVRSAGVAVAAAAGSAVAWLHQHSAAGLSAVADTASVEPSGIPDPAFAAIAGSAAGASVQVAD